MDQGYKANLLYLSDILAKKGVKQRYKFIFDIEHPSLAFVGFVCPMVGSVTVASVFSDKINLLCMVGKERSRKERCYFLALSLQEFITEK